MYVAATSALGLVASVSGLVMLTSAGEVALAVMVGAMVALRGDLHRALHSAGQVRAVGQPDAAR